MSTFIDLDRRIKECFRCRNILSFDDFGQDKARRGGCSPYCKSCLLLNRQESHVLKRKPRANRGFLDIEGRRKECSDCKAILPFDSFSPSCLGRGGRYHYCRACHRQRTREHRAKGLHITARQKRRVKQYGLTVDQYDAMLAAQKGACCICTVEMNPPHVDHCHTTGKVRGLLCHKCNTALGLLGDSADRLNVAADYLRRS